MNLRAVSKKLEIVAVISSLAAFACGIGTNTFEVSYLAIPAFWLLLLLSLITAALSFPRWQSLFALLLLPVSLICAMGGLPYLYHSTHPAPDGQYQLVVYSRMLPIAFPGQGSDAPGYVQLQDQAGRVIGSTHLYMVQQVYDARWEEDKVEFGLGRKASIPLR
jgi:hypothetical protein